MAVRNPYAAYANSKIMTASPAELTLMLYDGAIKFCNIAIMGIEEKDIEIVEVSLETSDNLSNIWILLSSQLTNQSFLVICDDSKYKHFTVGSIQE